MFHCGQLGVSRNLCRWSTLSLCSPVESLAGSPAGLTDSSAFGTVCPLMAGDSAILRWPYCAPSHSCSLLLLSVTCSFGILRITAGECPTIQQSNKQSDKDRPTGKKSSPAHDSRISPEVTKAPGALANPCTRIITRTFEQSPTRKMGTFFHFSAT